MSSFDAHPLSSSVHVLGEGPVWDGERQRILWVDIARGEAIEGRLDDGDISIQRTHTREGTVGAVVCRADGGLLIAGAKNLEANGVVVAELIPPEKGSRLNDGGCDLAGRFLVGSMALDGRTGEECLYRLEHDGTVTVLDDDLWLSNGLAWSPDGATMYSVDSVPGIVWVRDYDVESGGVGPRREWLRVDDATPDGLCLDVDGNIWLALWGGSQVRCLSPAAEVLATVHVDAPHTTSVAFVGAELDRLLVTTARQGLTEEQLAAHPDSGRLFIADVGARGLPTTPWSGVY
jgi:sugar lactone lactonase YvrE